MRVNQANKITAPNAGGPRQLAIRTRWAARVGELNVSRGSWMRMNHILLYEIAFYWPWYLCFAVIAFCLARWLGGLGLLPSALVISALIIFIEVRSVFHDMREHPEWGMDADFVFWFGVLCRLVFYNLVFLLVGILGWRLRTRHRRIAHETQIG